MKTLWLCMASIGMFCLASTLSCSRPSSEPSAEPSAEPIRLNPQLTVPQVTMEPEADAGEPQQYEEAMLGEINMDDLLVVDGTGDADELVSTTSSESGSSSDEKSRAQVAKLLAKARLSLKENDAATTARTAWEAWKLAPTSADQIADIAELLMRAKKLGPAIVVVDTASENGLANSKARVLLAQACLRVADLADHPDKRLALLDKAADALFELQRRGQLRKYGRSGAMLLLNALTAKAKLTAELGQRDESLQTIERLFDGGFSQISSLVSEPEFDELHADAAFRERIGEMRLKIRARLTPEIERRMMLTDPFDFDFGLDDTQGRKVRLDDFRGKVVIVDFWGTWCGPCRMEVAHLSELARQYENDLEVVGIAYEKALPARWPRIVADFVRKNEVPYTCVIGDNATKKQVPDFRSFPTLLFLDRSGTVRLKLVGYHGYEQLDAVVNLLMAERQRG